MKTIKIYLSLLFIISNAMLMAQTIVLKSPDNKIKCTVENTANLSYSVTFDGRVIISPSSLGFEFRDELPMNGEFIITGQSVNHFSETWKPVVKSKHAQIENNYNELQLILSERTGAMRCMDLIVRAYNDGVAFRYKLSSVPEKSETGRLLRNLPHSAFREIRKHGLLNMEDIPLPMKLNFLNIH